MKWFVIGLLLAIGWGLGKLFIDITYEVVFERLHRSDRYKKLCGMSKKNNEITQVCEDRRIGF